MRAFLLLLLVSFSHAKNPTADYSVELPDLRLEKPLNGIEPKEFVDFWDQWKLVSIRYRQDTGEQRFVYANPIAWKAMKGGKSSYPSGALFAKIAFATQGDPSFPVSLEPSRVERIQVMKKMATGFRKTNGWAYAIYVGKNKPFPFGEEEVKACHGCHALVAKRDYIFARPVFLNEKQSTFASELKDRFKKTTLQKLEPKLVAFVRSLAPAIPEELHAQPMPLFYGSLFETGSSLTLFASDSKSPYLLYDPQVAKRLLLAVPEPPDAQCARKGTLFTCGSEQIGPRETPRPRLIVVDKARYCNGNFNWEKHFTVPQ
jgi:hypothetical protein